MSGLLRPVTEVTISAAFVFGMVLALLGSLKLALAKRLDLGEGRVAGLLSAFNLALMPMVLLSGVIIDLEGARFVVILGSAATAMALFSLSMRPSFGRAFAAVLLAGLGGAGLSTASVVLMPDAFYGHARMSASLNLGYVFVALGALVTPVLVDLLTRGLGFRRAAGLMALVCLVPGVLAALSGGEALPAAHGRTADLAGLLGQPAVWLAGLVFFLYAPLEGSIGIWATTYLTEMGHGERRATWMLAGFWGAFLAARLAAAYLAQQGLLRPEWDAFLLVVPALLTAVVLGNLAGTADRGAAPRGLLTVGFLLGPFFPTLVGMVFQRLEAENVTASGTAYGALFALGSLGGLVLAPVVGGTARRRTVQSALRVPMFLALLLTAVALVFGLVR